MTEQGSSYHQCRRHLGNVRHAEHEASKDLPASSATKRARPMPRGAMNVTFDFSAASMRMVKIKIKVRNISMKTPWAMDVPLESVVLT